MNINKILVSLIFLVIMVGGIFFFTKGSTEEKELSTQKLSQEEIGSIIEQLEGNVVKKKLPNLSLFTFDGEKISFSDYQGKTLFISMWASWCKFCRQEAPHIVKLVDSFSDNTNINFLSISIDEAEENARAFMQEYSLNLPVLSDPKAGATGKTTLKIGGTPSVFIVSPEGYIIGRFDGHKWGEKAKIKLLETLVNGL